MELVTLGGINKEEFLASLDAKGKEQKQQEESAGCKIEIFNPMPAEGIVDAVVSKKLAEMRSVEVEKMKAEEVEREKFKNAVTFTDIPATIKKAGFYSDGSPRMAIAGLLHGDVRFDISSQQAKYHSESAISFNDSLEIVLSDIKIDRRSQIYFFVGFVAVMASMFIATQALSSNPDVTILIVGFVIPFLTLIVVSVFYDVLRYDKLFSYLALSDIGKVRVRTRSNFITKVPTVLESVLSKISGPGPFAILFEVTQGWKKIKLDPVIFRVINIGDSQFFEPMVGYDMTPLEKKSLVEKT